MTRGFEGFPLSLPFAWSRLWILLLHLSFSFLHLPPEPHPKYSPLYSLVSGNTVNCSPINSSLRLSSLIASSFQEKIPHYKFRIRIQSSIFLHLPLSFVQRFSISFIYQLFKNLNFTWNSTSILQTPPFGSSASVKLLSTSSIPLLSLRVPFTIVNLIHIREIRNNERITLSEKWSPLRVLTSEFQRQEREQFHLLSFNQCRHMG